MYVFLFLSFRSFCLLVWNCCVSFVLMRVQCCIEAQPGCLVSRHVPIKIVACNLNELECWDLALNEANLSVWNFFRFKQW
jgi:hypothetical protein